MGDVIRVGTSVDCAVVGPRPILSNPTATRMHNALGCYFMQLFQAMFDFNVSYVIVGSDAANEEVVLSLLEGGAIDVYARPVALRSEILDSAYPIHALFWWRLGFILRREHKHRMLRRFYSKPFCGLVWLCLYCMTLLTPLLFYALSRWERQLGSHMECSVVLELLLAIGGFCQHSFPVETSTLSRRLAYFTFFLFAYVVYTFYTSNLLSHLVNDKDNEMTLQELAESGYSYMFLEGIKEYKAKILSSNASLILKDIFHIPIVNISTGLDAVRRNKTALLSDYAMVYHELSQRLTTKEICDIIEIDLFSRVQKYLITTKTFRYKEQMKISTLRMHEAGILRRLVATIAFTPVECAQTSEVTTSIEQVSGLLLLLLCWYLFTLVLLMCERLHYKRYRLFPYIE